MFFQNLWHNPILGFFVLVSMVIGISVHEYSHAKAADELGDPTPRSMGRLTLNPKVHLDILGTFSLLIFGFGWGKPVVFDPFNLKNPRRDAAIISLAGPLSNLMLAGFAAFFSKLLTLLFVSNSLLYLYLGLFLYFFAGINLMLAFFNLVPIYPLDGFKIVEGLLPEEKVHQWQELASYGTVLLLLFILPFSGRSLASKTIGVMVNFFLGLLF